MLSFRPVSPGLSDIYLELNLSEEAREMAHEGFSRFQKLGWARGRETLANEATAYGQQARPSRPWSALPKRGNLRA